MKQSRRLSDEDIVGIRPRAKKRREAASAFADAGRDEMAAKDRGGRRHREYLRPSSATGRSPT